MEGRVMGPTGIDPSFRKRVKGERKSNNSPFRGNGEKIRKPR